MKRLGWNASLHCPNFVDSALPWHQAGTHTLKQVETKVHTLRINVSNDSIITLPLFSPVAGPHKPPVTRIFQQCKLETCQFSSNVLDS